MGLCGTLWGSMRLRGALWGSVGLCATLWGSVRLCGALWGSVGLCGTGFCRAFHSFFGVYHISAAYSLVLALASLALWAVASVSAAAFGSAVFGFLRKVLSALSLF